MSIEIFDDYYLKWWISARIVGHTLSGRYAFFQGAEKYAVSPTTFRTEFNELDRPAKLTSSICYQYEIVVTG